MTELDKKSAPVYEAAHNSGEGDPAVTLGYAGADAAFHDSPVRYPDSMKALHFLWNALADIQNTASRATLRSADGIWEKTAQENDAEFARLTWIIFDLTKSAHRMREALGSIAGWGKINLSAQWEQDLRDIIKSITDCADAALAAPQAKDKV